MPVYQAIFRVLDNTLQDRNGPIIRKAGLLDYSLLLVAAGMWGGTFLLNEVALVDFPPVAIAGYRIVLAAIILTGVCFWKNLVPRFSNKDLMLILVIGLLNSIVPFTLIGWGQLSIDSATTAILLAASPFFTLLLSHYMTGDDRFTWNKLFGLMFGFVGVLFLVWHGMQLGSGSLSAMLVVILASCCYSFSSILIRRLGRVPSLLLVASTLVVASVAVIPIMLIWYPPWEQGYSSSSLAAVLFLALGPTAVAYVLRVQIVQNNGAVFMSNVGYLIPLFAVFWGWLFLSHIPSLNTWISLILIFIGIALGQRKAQSR